MFELSINLLRVLEFFTAKYVPAAQHAASMLHLFKDLVHAAVVSELTHAVADRQDP